MAIDFDAFKNWAENKFGIKNVIVKGNEVRINSIFAEADEKHHLWCNPSGGKNQRPFGVYHCFKSDRKGSLVSLVMDVEKCSKPIAMQLLGITKYKGRPIEEMDSDYLTEEEEKDFDLTFKTVSLPPFTFPVKKAPLTWYQKATNYLAERGFSNDKFHVCTSGKYINRIIIPYHYKNGELIYFNARSMGNEEPKYRGPEKECGVGKEDVLFFTNFPEKEEKIYLCEGEFDALSLNIAGFNAVACGGKNLGEKQSLMLAYYKVCLALDRDEAGQSAIKKMVNMLFSCGYTDPESRISIVLPPQDFKDWNALYKQHGLRIVKEFVNSKEKPFILGEEYVIN
jgi:DNA primase